MSAPGPGAAHAARTDRPAGGEDPDAGHPVRELARGYAHGHDIDPALYGPFMGAYLAAVATYAAAFRRSGRSLPRVSGADVALIGTATFKMSRLISRDKVTSVVRFPFTRYEGSAPGPEVNEEPRGGRVRRLIGEMLTCPFCTSQWAGTALMALYLVSPPAGRATASLLSALSISDGLQYAETAVHQALGQHAVVARGAR